MIFNLAEMYGRMGAEPLDSMGAEISDDMDEDVVGADYFEPYGDMKSDD